jgi:hypothetical protein
MLLRQCLFRTVAITQVSGGKEDPDTSIFLLLRYMSFFFTSDSK